MTSVSVRSVCVVHRLTEVSNRVGVSGIDKRPVDGPVRVHEHGLRGDVQADRKNHGGEWKAVYLLDDADVAGWEPEFGRPVAHGEFGENLRLAGTSTTDWVIGSEIAVGDELVLQVTTPRTPCANFGEYLGREDWSRRFIAAGRPGAYTRVLRQGEVSAGDDVRFLRVPEHGVTIGEVFAGVSPEQAARILDELDESEIAPKLLATLRGRVAAG